MTTPAARPLARLMERAGGRPVVAGWPLAATAVAIVLGAPLIAVVASLATPAVDVWAHLWRTQLVELVLNTVLLLVGVGGGTLVLGVGLAWLVVGYRFPGRAVLEWALLLPLAMPAYVIGFAVLGIVGPTGSIQRFIAEEIGLLTPIPDPRAYWGVAGVMTLVFYPYVYLLARAAFREHGAATLETARALGCSRRRAFLRVTLPMARPAIVAGVALAMMEALADFGTVAAFGYRTLTEAVYRVWYGMFDRAAAAQLASLLLLLALALLALERALRRRARFYQSARRGPVLAPVPLRGFAGWLATGACASVLALGFVIPVLQLLAWAHESAEAWDTMLPAFARLVANTTLLAAAAAVTAVVIGFVLAYAVRLRPSSAVRGAARLAGMGYALPGSVIAVGVLGVLTVVDHFLADGLEIVLGRPTALLLTGSAIGLVYAYVVRFLAVGLQTIEAGIAKIPPSLDDAARSLGCRPTAALRRIHLPLMRRSTLAALVLVFVETTKEMPATLLLRPFGFDTLAVAVWERTSESLWAEATLPALAIVATALVPVVAAIHFTRAADR